MHAKNGEMDMKIPMLVTTGLAALLLAGTSVAQNWQLEPTYGTARLAAGFQPDPHTVELQAGGDIDARGLGEGCAGLVADAPDYDLQYEAGSYPLGMYVRSSADTTLVVNAPDGTWHCADDSVELDPVIVFDPPQSGLYDIWVGSFSGFPEATLTITERVVYE